MPDGRALAFQRLLGRVAVELKTTAFPKRPANALPFDSSAGMPNIAKTP